MGNTNNTHLFHAGDWVKVSNFIEEGYYRGSRITKEMAGYAGGIYTVKSSEVDSLGYEWITLREDKEGFVFPAEYICYADKPCDAEHILLGVSPDAPVVENELGGKQSDTPYGFHLFPLSAVFAAAQTAKYGADKYGETFGDRNYVKIPSEDHINHAIAHLYAHLSGDKQDDHLAHAIVRCMFAYDTAKREGKL